MNPVFNNPYVFTVIATLFVIVFVGIGIRFPDEFTQTFNGPLVRIVSLWILFLAMLCLYTGINGQCYLNYEHAGVTLALAAALYYITDYFYPEGFRLMRHKKKKNNKKDKFDDTAQANTAQVKPATPVIITPSPVIQPQVVA